MTDFPAEVAQIAYDLAKAIITRPAKFGFLTADIDGQEVTVVVGFDDVSRRLNDLMSLAIEADAGTEDFPE